MRNTLREKLEKRKKKSDADVERAVLQALSSTALILPIISTQLSEKVATRLMKPPPKEMINYILSKLAEKGAIRIKSVTIDRELGCEVIYVDASIVTDLYKECSNEKEDFDFKRKFETASADEGADSDDMKKKTMKTDAHFYATNNTRRDASAMSDANDDIMSLLSMPSTREKQSKQVGEEILELLTKPTAKERSVAEKFKSHGGAQVMEFCPHGTKVECLRAQQATAEMALKKKRDAKLEKSTANASSPQSVSSSSLSAVLLADSSDSNSNASATTTTIANNNNNNNINNSGRIEESSEPALNILTTTLAPPVLSNTVEEGEILSTQIENEKVSPTLPKDDQEVDPVIKDISQVSVEDIEDNIISKTIAIDSIITKDEDELSSTIAAPTSTSALLAMIDKCTKLHFKKIIQSHTDESLGDCSFLNTCFHMATCKYVHYEVDTLPHINTNKPIDVKTNLCLKRSIDPSVTLYPPQWIQCDLRFLDMTVLGKFAVVMADPPWDIHMELPYGTMSDDEMRQLGVPALQTDGLIFLWVTGRAMELGRECLKLWGYERVDELIWVKTNQLQRIIRTGRTGHWLNHGKEHCLVGMKGNPTNLNRGLDCDVIVAEVRATSHKPDEIYGIIERLSPGTRKIELFGRPHNVQPNWITLGNQLDGIRLVDPELITQFQKRYPDGNCMSPVTAAKVVTTNASTVCSIVTQ